MFRNAERSLRCSFCTPAAMWVLVRIAAWSMLYDALQGLPKVSRCMVLRKRNATLQNNFRIEGERTMAKNTSVLGIYSSRSALESAIDAFREAGWAATDISVLLPENLGPRELATQKETKAPEGATAGAGTGAVIGGALGWLAGIGALAIPGLGPFIAAGPIMATLAGIGVGGAVGGFSGLLIGLGLPEYEAKHYEARMQKGGILLSVNCESSEEIDRAKRIMERAGAEDISVVSEPSGKSDIP